VCLELAVVHGQDSLLTAKAHLEVGPLAWLKGGSTLSKPLLKFVAIHAPNLTETPPHGQTFDHQQVRIFINVYRV